LNDFFDLGFHSNVYLIWYRAKQHKEKSHKDQIIYMTFKGNNRGKAPDQEANDIKVTLCKLY
jgi:hypothetical protein